MDTKIQNIGIDIIDDPEHAMRTIADVEKLEELAHSIQQHGLISPLIVRPVGKRYEVVAGHRRLLALKHNRVSLVPCIVQKLDDQSTDAVRMAENLYREDVNIVDEARYIKHLVDDKALDFDQLAAMTRKSVAYLRVRYDLMNFPDYILTPLQDGTIGLTAAQYLSRIGDENIRREYVRFGVSGGITAERARAWYESWKLNQLPRDATTYQPPLASVSAGPVVITMPCALCQTKEDIRNMTMAYVHPACSDFAEQSARNALSHEHSATPPAPAA